MISLPLRPLDKKFFQKLISIRHPIYTSDATQWDNWRRAYEGGEDFLNHHLVKFSKRESKDSYNDRKEISPVSAYAKSAINRVRNSIFQRMGDVVRRDGSHKYQESVAGERGGVDRRGSSMNFFIGKEVLTELLVMGQIGCYVDMPKSVGPTLANAITAKPYCYLYRREDILSWRNSNPEDPSEFQALLLRDVDLSLDEDSYLPIDKALRYRWVFINPSTGRVNTQFISDSGEPGELIELNLTRIPFHVFDIGDSLIKDVWRHQVAILNTDSANVNYNALSNFPFYVEKESGYGGGGYLRQANADGTATEGGQPADEEEVEVGNMTARTYPEEKPDFIAPPTEPLKGSLLLREELRKDIERIINLSVEAKGEDEGLESGLSFIANVLQTGERKIAEFWAAYEGTTQVATIKYPERFSLKSEQDRIEESTKLSDLMYRIPGRTIKKELAKSVVSTLLSGRVNSERLASIYKEIDEASYCTSDPDTVSMAIDKGLVSTKTGSISLGYPEDEHIQAEEDRIRRLKAMAEAQTPPGGELQNPASRGIDDKSVAPRQESRDEKELGRITDEQTTPESRVRGEQQ